MDYSLSNKSVSEQICIITAAKCNQEVLGLVIEANQNLIWHTACKFTRDIYLTEKTYQVERQDIYQIACEGFIKAIKSFDPDRNNKFSTYAVPTIFREVKSYFRDHGRLIRPTRTASILMNQVTKLQREHPLGEYLSNEEISSILDVPLEKIDKAKTVGDNLFYIEEGLSCPYNCSTPIDNIKDDFNLEERSVSSIYANNLLESICKKITPVEKRILDLKINMDLNYVEIAQCLNIEHIEVVRAFRKIRRITTNILHPSKTKAIKRKRTSKYINSIKSVVNILLTNPDATIEDIRRIVPLNTSTQSIYYIKKMAIQEIKKRKL